MMVAQLSCQIFSALAANTFDVSAIFADYIVFC